MEKQLHRLFYEIEDTHWWSVGMRKIQLHFLKKYLKVKNPLILDVGCGTGRTLKELSKIGKTIGVDSSSEALKFCRMRGLKNVYFAKATKLPFKNNFFNCVTMFDVIEHIKDDVKALKEVERVLKNNGIALFTTPAFMFLWDDHDRMNRHYRRYTLGEFTKKLDKASLKLIYISYFNTFLFPLVVVFKVLNQLLGRKRFFNNQKTEEPLNSLLLRIFSAEKILLDFLKFPFGISILCVAKKVNRK